MLLYQYKGLDSRGDAVLGNAWAASEPTLKLVLYKQGILVQKVRRQSLAMIQARRWLAAKHTLLFLSQLSAMLKTGITLGKAVNILRQNQLQKQLVDLLSDLDRQLNAGRSLSASLDPYPLLFDKIIIQLLKSGEASGRIDNAVKQAAEYYRQKQHNANQMMTALLYPLMLLLVTIAVLATMTVFVIPQFETIYTQSSNELPWLTRIILTASNVLRDHGGLIVIFLACAWMAAYLLDKNSKVRLGRLVPGLERLSRQINTLRFCQTLAELYSAGLAITYCLESCRGLSPNPEYKQAINASLSRIRQGFGLADALDSAGYFDPMLVQLVRTGEESASLADMLGQCAQYYDSNLNNSLTRLKILLEPLMIVFLGGVIGIILVAMYLPVFSMGSSF